MFDFERCLLREMATGKEKLTGETSISAHKSEKSQRRILKKTSSMILQHVVLSQ